VPTLWVEVNSESGLWQHQPGHPADRRTV